MTIRLGIFDSGIGGFSVLKRVLERHRNISCVYLGDTARVPYGGKSATEIRLIAEEVVEWLLRQDVQAIVVACNTTNSLAMDLVTKIVDIPVFGLIESVPMMIYEDRIGVLATASTAQSGSYKRTILAANSNAIVIEQGCPGFVPMIEMGQVNNLDLRLLAFDYLKPMLKEKVEAVVLGCSHYPFLTPLLKQILPEYVRLVDPAIGLSAKLDVFINDQKTTLDSSGCFSNTRFCVTSDPVGFASRAQHWLGITPEVELVSLRSKSCVF